MKFCFTCTACGKSYQVDDMLAGKRTKCRACGVAMRVPYPAIQLGPADGPLPGSLPLPEMELPKVAVDIAEAQKPAPKSVSKPKDFKPAPAFKMKIHKVRNFDPSPRRAAKFPAWIAHIISFILGGATTIAVILLHNAATPVVVPPPPKPDVAIQVHLEPGSLSNADDITKLAIDTITRELAARDVRVRPDAPVVVMATIRKRPGMLRVEATSTMPASNPAASNPATTSPAATLAATTAPATPQPVFNEELFDISLVFIDAANQPFFTFNQPADPKNGIGVNLHPDKLPLTNGMTLPQAISAAQWKDAAERFSQLGYPPTSEIRDAETATAPPPR